jgi:hypothetical protein
MKRPSKSLVLSVAVLLLTTHPLPAPIFEPPEKATATPKPKSKPTEKPSTKSPAKTQPAVRNAAPPPAAPAETNRFAGTWVGTMQTIPWGNWAVVLTVDSKETTLAQEINGGKSEVKKAVRNGDTLQASFPTGLTAITWSLTPQAGGATARVRMQAFMNDFTAVFHRTVSQSSAAKSAR